MLNLLLFPVVAIALTANTATVSWQDHASMPLPVQEIYPVLHQNTIVVAGGLSSELSGSAAPVTARVQQYSLSSQRWQDGIALPEPRHHSHLVSVAGKLFSLGGFVVTEQGWWTNSRDILLLDETAGQWQKVAELPAPLSEAVATVIAEQVHIASGRTATDANNGQWRDNTDVSWHWVFDPHSYQIREAAPVPTARNSAAAALLNGRWHLVGGRTVADGNLAVHEVFDPVANSWKQLAPLPQAQAGLAAAVVGDSLLVFGGEHFNAGGGVFDKVWQYLPAEDRWQVLTTLPIARHGHGAVVVGEHVYVIGGAAEAGLKATLGKLQRLTVTTKTAH